MSAGDRSGKAHPLAEAETATVRSFLVALIPDRALPARVVAVAIAPAALVVAMLAAPAVASRSSSDSLGALTQLPGEAGCLNEFVEGCGPVRALLGESFSVVVAPDGRSVYLSDETVVAVFGRSSHSGTLAQLTGRTGCLSGSEVPGCANGRALGEFLTVAASPDGRNLYVASDEGVAVFARARRNGALRQLRGRAGCLSQTTERCAPARALGEPLAVAVSRDGRSVYVASHEGLAVARRNRDTGALTQLTGKAGCLSGRRRGCARARAVDGASAVAVSPDGSSVYVGSEEGLAVFGRDRDTGALRQLTGRMGCLSRFEKGCAPGARALTGASAVTVSPDGRSVYVASAGGVAVFRRDRDSGAPRQLAGRAGCVSIGARRCALLRPFGSAEAYAVALSPDGRSVYVGTSYGVATFRRDRTSGALRQLAGEAGCVGELAGCRPARGVGRTPSVALSPDGRNVYTNIGAGVAAFARQAR